MKLEDQVCSLELSKKLKELGVKQESLFYWVKEKYYDFDSDKHLETIFPLTFEFSLSGETELEALCSTFTVAELGEILPYKVGGHTLKLAKGADGYCIYYEEDVGEYLSLNQKIPSDVEDKVEDNVRWVSSGKLADALAKMMIMLI